MSGPKKPKKPRKPTERKPIVWPPEEWPEEARQAEIAAFEVFMDRWWRTYCPHFFADETPPQPSAQIIPFPKGGRRAVKARDTHGQDGKPADE